MKLGAFVLALGCGLGLLFACGGPDSSKTQADPPKCLPIFGSTFTPQDSDGSLPKLKTWVVLQAPDLFIPTYSNDVCDPKTPDEAATASARPFSYKWAITKLPNNDATIHLLKADDAEGSTDYVEGKEWSADFAKVKFYAAEAGDYEFEITAKDAYGRMPGPSSVCPGCFQVVKLPVQIKAEGEADAK